VAAEVSLITTREPFLPKPHPQPSRLAAQHSSRPLSHTPPPMPPASVASTLHQTRPVIPNGRFRSKEQEPASRGLEHPWLGASHELSGCGRCFACGERSKSVGGIRVGGSSYFRGSISSNLFRMGEICVMCGSYVLERSQWEVYFRLPPPECSRHHRPYRPFFRKAIPLLSPPTR
jgi:hypothetical protein